jgi:hypothetical protein
MKFFGNLMKKIDLFGAPIQFNYKKKTTLQTHFGGLVTIILGLLTCGLVYYLGSDMILKNKPFSTVSKVRKPSSEAEVYFKDTPIFYALYNVDGSPLEDYESLLTIKVTAYFTNNQSAVERGTNLTLENCNPDRSFGSYKDLVFEFANVTNLYCYNFTDSTKIKNERAALDSIGIQTDFSVCNNKTDNKVCASQEKIDEKLTVFYVRTLYPNYYINSDKNVNPQEVYLDSLTQQLGLNTYRTNNIIFKKSEISTDNGVILDEPETFQVTQFDLFTSDTALGDKNDIKYSTTLTCRRIFDTYKRSYVKIQDVIGSLGGFLNALMVVGQILCSYIAESSFYIQQTIDLVNFTDNTDTNNEDSMLGITVIPFINATQHTQGAASNNDLRMMNDVDLKDLNNNKVDRQEIIKAKVPKINKKDIGFCDFMSTKCSSNNVKVNQKAEFYAAVNDHFYSQLDINSLTTMRHEFDIIKYIMLNDHRDVFKFKLPLYEIIEKYELEKKKNEEREKKEEEDDTKPNTVEEKDLKEKNDEVKTQKESMTMLLGMGKSFKLMKAFGQEES